MKYKNYLIIDSSESNSDLFYKTKFFVPDPVIFLEHRGKSTLVLNDLEYDRGKSESDADEVLSYSSCVSELRKKKIKNISSVDVVDYILRQKRIKSLTVQKHFPLHFADELRKRGYSIRSTKDLMLYPERLKKSSGELRNLKNSIRKTTEAMNLAIQMVSKSVIKNNKLYYRGSVLTSEKVKGSIDSYLARNGFTASHTIVACGKHSWMPHNTGRGQLYAHKPIIIDIFPRSQTTGYFGDMTRTVVKGKPPEKLVDMYKTVLEGQKMGIKLIRNKTKGRDIHSKILELFKKRGFNTENLNGKPQGFIHSTGHGLGLDIHEPPRIGMSNEILEEGNVVTVEPGLYYEKLGGIRIEDVVYVTNNGCRNLTRYKKQFVV